MYENENSPFLTKGTIITVIIIGTVIGIIATQGQREEKKHSEAIKGDSYILELPQRKLLIDGLQKENLERLNSDALLGLGPTGLLIECKTEEFRFGRNTDYLVRKVESDYKPSEDVIDCRN